MERSTSDCIWLLDAAFAKALGHPSLLSKLFFCRLRHFLIEWLHVCFLLNDNLFIWRFRSKWTGNLLLQRWWVLHLNLVYHNVVMYYVGSRTYHLLILIDVRTNHTASVLRAQSRHARVSGVLVLFLEILFGSWREHFLFLRLVLNNYMCLLRCVWNWLFVHQSCSYCWVGVGKVVAAWRQLWYSISVILVFVLLISLTRRVHATVVSVVATLSTCRLDISSLLCRLIIHSLFLFQHFFVEVFIMIIPYKGLMLFIWVEQLHVLEYLFTILIFPFTVCVGGIKVVLVWWCKWTWYSLVKKVFPWKITQPRVVPYIFWSVEA